MHRLRTRRTTWLAAMRVQSALAEHEPSYPWPKRLSDPWQSAKPGNCRAALEVTQVAVAALDGDARVDGAAADRPVPEHVPHIVRREPSVKHVNRQAVAQRVHALALREADSRRPRIPFEQLVNSEPGEALALAARE